MKIVFLIQNFSRAGGSERVTCTIANYLCTQGFDVAILSICGNNTCFFDLDKSATLDTLINKKSVDNRKEFLIVLLKYYVYIRKNRPDVIIDVFASLSIYTNILKPRFKFKNITWEHYNYLNNMGLNKIGRKIAIKFSDRIVTLSQTDMDLYISANPNVKNKIQFIYNPTPYPKAEIGQEKKHIVLAVGRLEKLKGFSNLLDAWQKIPEKYPEWTLYIIGEGEDRILLENKIKNEKIINVKLLGQVNDLDTYYLISDILVSTSEREGLPMAMIEAQSFGLPIVSFDYMTGPRDIISNKIDGFIVEGTTQEEMNDNLRDLIIQLIRNPELRYKMGYTAKMNSKRFSIEHIGDKWLKILASL